MRSGRWGALTKSSDDEDAPALVQGARELPRVIIEGYGQDVRTKDGYFGDLASNPAFRQLVKDLRGALSEGGGDPIENEPAELTRRRIDKLLKEGDAPSVGVIVSAVEQFAQNLARVVKALCKLKNWARRRAHRSWRRFPRQPRRRTRHRSGGDPGARGRSRTSKWCRSAITPMRRACWGRRSCSRPRC